jgi:hypothetical protein
MIAKLLGLSRRHVVPAPTSLFAVIPSRRTTVVITGTVAMFASPALAFCTFSFPSLASFIAAMLAPFCIMSESPVAIAVAPMLVAVGKGVSRREHNADQQHSQSSHSKVTHIRLLSGRLYCPPAPLLKCIYRAAVCGTR